MPRPTITVPLHEDLKSIRTLLEEGMTQEKIVVYYQRQGIRISQQTISNKIKELKES